MKKVFASLALALGLTLTAKAQQEITVTNVIYVTNNGSSLTISGPLWDVLTHLSTATNLGAGAYGTFNLNSKDKGAGVFALYNFNTFVGTGARLDYLSAEKTVYLPSFDVQLQAPITFGKLTLVPFGLSGIATPIAGKGINNGSAVGIFGVGTAVRFGPHFDLIADYEKWSGFQGNFIRAGFLWKF